jgi:hypothetical protein
VSRPTLGPTQSPVQSVPGLFSQWHSGWGIKLATRLVPRLRRHGSIPPFPHAYSWCGARVQLYIYMQSGVVISCSPSSPQSFMVSGPVRTHDRISVRSKATCVLKLGLLFDERTGDCHCCRAGGIYTHKYIYIYTHTHTHTFDFSSTSPDKILRSDNHKLEPE